MTDPGSPQNVWCSDIQDGFCAMNANGRGRCPKGTCAVHSMPDSWGDLPLPLDEPWT